MLGRLADHGLLERRRGGAAWLYELNRRHLAAPAVEQLVSLRALLVERLRTELRGWRVEPAGAALFGSAARGDGDLASDIDLLILRPDRVDGEGEAWRGQIDGLSETVREWTGNHAGIVELALGDLPGVLDRQPPILESIRADAVDLAGRPVRTLLREASIR